jgi:TRAP-type mannitol/chloroaromatic compound transport system substrate-binding protein
VRIYYNEHLWYGWKSAVWNSPTYQIYIHDAYEKIYDNLKPEVTDMLNNAQKANYESPIAKSKVSQAKDEYDLAFSLAAQGKWDGAVLHLQTSANILSEAAAEETVYQKTKQQQQQQQQQSYIWILTVIIAVVIAIVITKKIKTKKQSFV